MEHWSVVLGVNVCLAAALVGTTGQDESCHRRSQANTGLEWATRQEESDDRDCSVIHRLHLIIRRTLAIGAT